MLVQSVSRMRLIAMLRGVAMIWGALAWLAEVTRLTTALTARSAPPPAADDHAELLVAAEESFDHLTGPSTSPTISWWRGPSAATAAARFT